MFFVTDFTPFQGIDELEHNSWHPILMCATQPFIGKTKHENVYQRFVSKHQLLIGQQNRHKNFADTYFVKLRV